MESKGRLELKDSVFLIIAVWNRKGYSIRYQNAGNSGPALVLAHSFGTNRTLPLSSSPVVTWKLPSLANLLQQQIHLPLGLPAPICCWKLPPAAESLLLFPLDFCRSFSWLVLIKPSPSEFGCEMPCLVLSMKASMMETQEEKDRFRKVSQRLTEHLHGIAAMVMTDNSLLPCTDHWNKTIPVLAKSQPDIWYPKYVSHGASGGYFYPCARKDNRLIIFVDEHEGFSTSSCEPLVESLVACIAS
ncbi:hypothetical protein D5086_000059 [Populus alba]|uniref:Uncharacterized protein n=1 Tax=Populus alba TaxID=43335 RepID=A0ACC4CW46_POPAL